MNKMTPRKSEKEKDGDYGSMKQKYDLNSYANHARRENLRVCRREAAEQKAGLKDIKENDDNNPRGRFSGHLEAKTQYCAKRQRGPAVIGSQQRETKRPCYEATVIDAEDRIDEENDRSGPVKMRVFKRESRTDLEKELDRLKQTRLGLVEAITKFRDRLTTVLEASYDDEELQGVSGGSSSSLYGVSDTGAESNEP